MENNNLHGVVLPVAIADQRTVPMSERWGDMLTPPKSKRQSVAEFYLSEHHKDMAAKESRARVEAQRQAEREHTERVAREQTLAKQRAVAALKVENVLFQSTFNRHGLTTDQRRIVSAELVRRNRIDDVDLQNYLSMKILADGKL